MSSYIICLAVGRYKIGLIFDRSTKYMPIYTSNQVFNPFRSFSSENNDFFLHFLNFVY